METIDKICMKLQRTVRFRSTRFLSKRFNDIILSSSAMYEMKELRFNYLIRTEMARLKFHITIYALFVFNREINFTLHRVSRGSQVDTSFARIPFSNRPFSPEISK